MHVFHFLTTEVVRKPNSLFYNHVLLQLFSATLTISKTNMSGSFKYSNSNATQNTVHNGELHQHPIVSSEAHLALPLDVQSLHQLNFQTTEPSVGNDVETQELKQILKKHIQKRGHVPDSDTQVLTSENPHVTKENRSKKLGVPAIDVDRKLLWKVDFAHRPRKRNMDQSHSLSLDPVSDETLQWLQKSYVNMEGSVWCVWL